MRPSSFAPALNLSFFSGLGVALFGGVDERSVRRLSSGCAPTGGGAGGWIGPAREVRLVRSDEEEEDDEEDESPAMPRKGKSTSDLLSASRLEHRTLQSQTIANRNQNRYEVR